MKSLKIFNGKVEDDTDFTKFLPHQEQNREH